MNEEPYFIFKWRELIMIILDKTGCILSYKKDQWKGIKFFIFPFFTKQVKEIQEELDKLSPHKIKHTKKVWCNLNIINIYL